MPTEIVDLPLPSSQSSGGHVSSGGAAGHAATVTEVFDPGTLRSAPASTGAEPVFDTVVGWKSERALSETAKKLMDAMPGDRPAAAQPDTAAARPPQPAQQPTDSAPAAGDGAPAPASTPPAPEGSPAAGAPIPAAELERLTAANQRLLADLEAARKAPRGGDRERALDEIEGKYLDDSVGSIRRLIGLSLGVPPDHKDVDAELSGLYQDLTEIELKVPIDSAERSKRESSRTRHMLARERRERVAEAERAQRRTADPDAAQTMQHVQTIDTVLSRPAADGKRMADRFPMLAVMSEHTDGAKPAELIRRGIKLGLEVGALSPEASNEALVEAVASRLETHYQALADKISQARKPSTATQPTVTAANDKQGEPTQRQEVRTITNATASVAPATPPAPKTPAAPDRPMSEKQRRLALIEKHSRPAG